MDTENQYYSSSKMLIYAHAHTDNSLMYTKNIYVNMLRSYLHFL